MAAQTAASIRYNNDMSVTYVFTSVADGDTFNPGKGKTRVTYQMTGNPTTQASAGNSVAYTASTGATVLYPGEDSLGGELTVFPK